MIENLQLVEDEVILVKSENVSREKANSGNQKLEVFLKQGQEVFYFLNREKKVCKEFEKEINKIVLGMGAEGARGNVAKLAGKFGKTISDSAISFKEGLNLKAKTIIKECPSCGAKSEGAKGSRIKWSYCGIMVEYKK